MINWYVIQWMVYVSTLVGSPIVFFFLVANKQEEDLLKAEGSFDARIEEKITEEKNYLNEKIENLQQALKEKDVLIKAKEEELSKIRPLLKYVRSVPQVPNGNVEAGHSGFNDDIL
jgi:DNA gyrase/topoisomerase IV subunit A